MFGWFKKKASPPTLGQETAPPAEAETISPVTARQETKTALAPFWNDAR
jgi:hypothetical protein